MADITSAKPFTRAARPDAVFTISISDLNRDFTLTLSARERILTELAKHEGWSREELHKHVLSLRQRDAELHNLAVAETAVSVLRVTDE